MGTNGTNGTEIVTEPRLEDEIFRLQRPHHTEAAAAIAKAQSDTAETGQALALAPLVDKIAHGIANGLVMAMKELENHIASETRKVGDAVDRRLDTIQDTIQGSLRELAEFVSEQKSINLAVQDQCQQLAGATAALQDSGSVQAAELAALRNRSTEFSQWVSERMDSLCKDLGIQIEDMAAVKSTLCTFSSRVDTLVERLDRQADAVRSICTAYSQRETELEQLVDGLARLRAYPTPQPTTGL